jgi:hypothetical protein
MTPQPANHKSPKTGIPNRQKTRPNRAVSCEIDYFRQVTLPSGSMAWPFFTDD